MRKNFTEFIKESSDRAAYEKLSSWFMNSMTKESDILDADIVSVGDATDSGELSGESALVKIKVTLDAGVDGVHVVAVWDNVQAEHATTLVSNKKDLVEMLNACEAMDYDEAAREFKNLEKDTVYCRVV